MHAIIAIYTLLIGIAIILAGNGLLGTLLGVRGSMEAFSSATLGLVMAAYFAGFILGTFWVPRGIRRVGHIRMFAALASLASVTALLHGLLVHPLAWIVLRVASGFCIVGLYIAIESWLNEQVGNEQRGHIFSVYMTTTLIGLGIGQVLLLTADPAGLQLFALASVLLSLGLVPVAGGRVRVALTRVSAPQVFEARRLGLRRLYAISPLGVVGCVFSGLGMGAFWGLGPVFAAGIGLDVGGIAGFMGLTIAGGILMLWPVGRLSDRFERRRIMMWVCVLAALGAAAAAWLVGLDARWALAGGFAYGAFAFSIYALSAAHTNDRLETSQMLEVSSSLQLLWGVGAVAGPALAGVFMQWMGPETLLPFIALAALAPGIFARWRMRISEPLPVDEQGEYLPQFVTSPAALEMYPDGANGSGYKQHEN